MTRGILLVIFLTVSTLGQSAFAGDVSIVFVECEKQGPGWRIAVTLRHADDGWNHYADEWRIVSETGEILAQRVLQHPHVEEQPFTRNLTGVQLPALVRQFYVEAHDKMHGWSKDRVYVDLNKPKGDRFRVR